MLCSRNLVGQLQLACSSKPARLIAKVMKKREDEILLRMALVVIVRNLLRLHVPPTFGS